MQISKVEYSGGKAQKLLLQLKLNSEIVEQQDVEVLNFMEINTYEQSIESSLSPRLLIHVGG